jgi:uncharacterized protein (DUF1330 family)
MASIEPSREQVAAFERGTPDEKPIVMLNLLRFRERASYRAGGPGGSGRDAYSRYGKAAIRLVWEVGGQVLWSGKVRAGVIVPEGEAWDEVVLVHYPSRRAFLRMVKSEAYQSIMHHRTAALADSRLLEMRASRLPRFILGAARGLFRAKAWVLPKID